MLSKILSKLKINKKEKKEPNTKLGKVLFRIRRALWAVCLTGVLTVFFTGCTFLWYAFIYVDGEFDLSSIDNSLNYTTTVYAMKDDEVVELDKLHGAENRIWVNINDIPVNLQKAFVAIEDERFYKHNGVDLKRTVSAVLNYFNPFSKKSYGGSSITQQLVKNVTTDDDQAITRKIQEMRRAWYLESQYKKDQILEVYLNTIYLSQGCNGVQTAAQKYFGKEVKDLTLAECACIASITKSPTYYDPLINLENNKTRSANVLNKMAELGFVTKEEADAAKEETLVFKSGSTTTEKASVKSYFVDAVTEAVIDDLVEQKGYSEVYAESLIYSGGLQIYTTMDVDVQEDLDSVYNDPSNFPSIYYKDKNGEKVGPQSAMAIIDNKTGAVVAIGGGIGEKTTARGLNRATQTFRQPGSSIKPLSTYAPAIEYGVSLDGNNALSPSSMILDWYTDPAKKYPRNQSRVESNKKVTLQAGVSQSLNTVAARVNIALGFERSLNFMVDNLGFTSIVTPEMKKSRNDQNVASLGLGGLTTGVNVVEMSAAYATFPNEGTYIKPYFYTKVVDQNGRVILENKMESRTAMSKETARTMNQLLATAVSSGTGTPARLGSTETAGKTGTTNDDNDRWFAGYTDYYSGVVWFGYDIPHTVYYSGQNPAATTWKKVMTKVHQGLAYKSLEKPTTLVYREYCFQSGMLPGEKCTMLATGQFLPDGVPTKVCDGVHPGEEPTEEKPEEKPETEKPAEKPETQKPEENPETEKPAEKPETQKPAEKPETEKPAEKPETEKPADTPTTEKPADKTETPKT